MIHSNIRVYLPKDIIGWIIGKHGWRIKQISKDTNTSIYYHDKHIDGYFSIKGYMENAHKARIILQSIEKAYYKIL